MRVVAALCTVMFCSGICPAQKAAVDLEAYKKNTERYAVAETSLTVGTHTYRLVNIRPLVAGDTVCISAVVIDKRKFTLYDVGTAGKPNGLLLPKAQPISDAVVVFKGGPVDGKTFLIFANGKIVTLPGVNLLVDKDTKTAYCVWDNGGQYQLTVLDYRNMRMLINSAAIARPAQWYNDGMSYVFKAADGSGFFSVDLVMAKSVVKGEQPSADAHTIPYVPAFESVDVKDCCGGKMWGR